MIDNSYEIEQQEQAKHWRPPSVVEQARPPSHPADLKIDNEINANSCHSKLINIRQIKDIPLVANSEKQFPVQAHFDEIAEFEECGLLRMDDQPRLKQDVYFECAAEQQQYLLAGRLQKFKVPTRRKNVMSGRTHISE